MNKILKEYWLKFIKIVKGLKFKQIIPLLILPIISLFVFFLPLNIQESFKLNIENPQIWQFFTFVFTHFDFKHLWDNIGLYLFVIPLVLILALKAKEMRRTNYLLIFALISFPIVSGLVDFYFTKSFIPVKIYQGASGMVSAIIGFIPLLWIKSINSKTKDLLRFWMLFIFYIILMFLFSYDTHLRIILILIFSAAILGLLILLRKEILIILKTYFGMSQNNMLFFVLSLLAILIFFASPNMIFPNQEVIISNGKFLDFFAHYFGIMYGLMTSYYFFKN